MTPGHNRDFLLDSGAVSALASDRDLLDAYVDLFEHTFDGSLLIPIPVLTEVRTGNPRYDTPVDRLVNTIRGEDDVYLPLTVEAASRAGVLRTQALQSTKRNISAIDAQIVGMAEERSGICAMTILTTDPDDINLLVGLTRRTNIAVDVPG
ncbi:MAG: type II toxin-antitoxin system VapC family toxin [Solirubrobacterales bacterium]